MTQNSDRAVTAIAGSRVDDVDHPPTDAHLSFVDEAAQTVGNIAGDGASSLRRNSSTVHSNTRVIAEIQLLPPTAFMSRADGTPILDIKTRCEQVSGEKRKKRLERDRNNSDATVPWDNGMKDAEDAAGDYGEQSENVVDHHNATELLYIRQTLRTFADNKDKLKLVMYSL